MVMDLVEQCSRIQMLRASDNLLMTDIASVTVSRLQHLRVLRLQERHVLNTRVMRPFVLRPLADGCPQLVEIDFGHLSVNMDDLKYFLNAKKNALKSLRIKWSMDGMRNGGLQELKVLSLPYGYGVEDNTVIANSHGCPSLLQLSITHSRKLSPAAFSEIDRLEHLEVELSVEGCQGDPKATDRLTEQMPNLVIRGNIHARLQIFCFGAPEDNRVNADEHSESDEDSDSDSSVGGSGSERG
ncbi:uncharacterized protein LOC124719075 [Schistocerca piceifrons]|uniref:uncharacterized protein LOC124719075 n=1 Tax=Schistocerca piceifrons TaxID=274613 RepID=UPI001F5E45A0|nr:uncharacterized protein LOC124719075 [Schistocerca piceifrons]